MNQSLEILVFDDFSTMRLIASLTEALDTGVAPVVTAEVGSQDESDRLLSDSGF